jgi:hypothetical protein
MSTINIVLGGAVNDGGIILKAGTINTTQNYSAITSLVGNYSLDTYPRTSVPVQNEDVTKALTGSNTVFAFNSGIPLIKGLVVAINNGHVDHELYTTGTVDTSLITNIHFRTSNINRLDTTAIRSQKFDIYTGKFDTGYPVVSVDNFGNDEAALVSRSNPGTLAFIVGKRPVSQSYN